MIQLGEKTTEIDSRYRMVVLAARRAKQLMRGAASYVPAKGHKATRVALEEVQKGMIEYIPTSLRRFGAENEE